MRDRLLDLIEKADLALSSCAGVLDEETLQPLVESVTSARSRLAYPESVMVVALAGGTGSGKSSLFNALSGEELVAVGGVRPTTSDPAAVVPASASGAMEGYLDRLGVGVRHTYELKDLSLIDLPDTDSVELDHRFQVDQILPKVDVVVWVADPEKYRDARLHHGYIAPLAAYSEQFLFVLNQVDRLREDETELVLADFTKALQESGLDSPIVVPIAAAPSHGPPQGLEEIARRIEQKRVARNRLYAKLLNDLHLTSKALLASTGGPVDFDARAAGQLDEATSLIIAGSADEASSLLIEFLDAVARQVGGMTARRVHRVAAEVPRHVLRITSEFVEHQASPRRWWQRRPPTKQRLEHRQVRDMLAEAVIRPARIALAQRAMAIASVADFALSVEELAAGLH